VRQTPRQEAREETITQEREVKAYCYYNRRKLVHEWRPTAVSRYFQTKCGGVQEHVSDLLHANLDGKPLCKRCFPVGKRDE